MTNDNEKKNEGSASGSGGGFGSGLAKWIWFLPMVVMVGILIAKSGEKKDVPARIVPAAVEMTGTQGVPGAATQAKILPRLVDLGDNESCKMMAPVLDDLKQTYAGKLDVQSIDVGQDAEAGRKYAIRTIPTQIFFDATGNELFRHEGFFGKEDILSLWNALGVDLDAK